MGYLEKSSFAAGLALLLNPLRMPLASSIGFFILNYIAVDHMIPRAGPALLRVGFKGTDVSKKNRPVIPETCGVIVGVVCLFSLIFFIPFLFYRYLVATVGGGVRVGPAYELDISHRGIFPHSKLSEYLSALLSLQSMLMLGVADDMFDIKWRHKFFLPAIAAIPMLLVYYVDFGVTQIIVPPFLSRWLGPSLDLGFLYYGYMAACAIFFTNCINIYAGVNGLEVGQSVVLGLCTLLNDSLYIFFLDKNHPAVESHSLSAYLLLPFLGGSIALLKYNWYPAKVFVGDTYCYFAGMVFAVISILGHFTKTLLSLSAPQIFNFIYSIPQLFHLVPCPRHRMPRFDPETNLLSASRAEVTGAKPIVKTFLRLLGSLKLLGVWETDEKMEISNMTLINLVLVHAGPLREDKLTSILLTIQGLWGVSAIVARHLLAKAIFGDNA